MTNDPVAIIKNDHREVEGLFKQYDEAGDGAVATRRKIVDEIITALEVHTEMEETFCYPQFMETFNKVDRGRRAGWRPALPDAFRVPSSWRQPPKRSSLG